MGVLDQDEVKRCQPRADQGVSAQVAQNSSPYRLREGKGLPIKPLPRVADDRIVGGPDLIGALAAIGSSPGCPGVGKIAYHCGAKGNA